jgi:hypothetical protein
VHFYSLKPDPDNKNVQNDANTMYRFKGPKGPNGYARISNSDVFLFRLGYFNYLKLNVESMIM